MHLDAHRGFVGQPLLAHKAHDFGGLPAHSLTNAGSDTREVFMEGVQKWFDVRARYVQWTDGNLAQMLIDGELDAVEDVLGPNLYCWNTNFFIK